METIGRFALGKNWRSATPKQQKEYLSLFEDMIVRVYSSRFKEYDGQDFNLFHLLDLRFRLIGALEIKTEK